MCSILAWQEGVSAGADGPRKMLLGGVILIGVVLGFGIGVAFARRRYLKARALDGGGEGTGFAIDQIQSLHEAGRISDEEFRTLRNATLGLDTAGKKKDNSVLSAAASPDDEDNDRIVEGLCTDADKEQQ